MESAKDIVTQRAKPILIRRLAVIIVTQWKKTLLITRLTTNHTNPESGTTVNYTIN